MASIGPASDSTVPRLPDWVISIKDKLKEEIKGPRSQEKLSIYRVPHSLKEPAHDRKSYIPQVVSLGPYHHGNKSLKEMEQHKLRALHHVLKRPYVEDIDKHLDAMKKLEKEARHYYVDQPVSLSSDEFVKMMVLDGSFMLELFRGHSYEGGFESLGYAKNDSVFSMNSMIISIQSDIIMLENQIPLFVLGKLLRLQTDWNHHDLESVAQLALKFFKPLTPTEPLMDESGLHFCRRKSRNLPKGVEPVPSTVLTPDESHYLHCLDVRNLLKLINEKRKQEKGFQPFPTDPVDHLESYNIPQVVSLGPYHHGKESLQEMEKHKWRALHHILKRRKEGIKGYLDAMKVDLDEEKARKCYKWPVSLSSQEFVEMMVLDGCFMLELFRGHAAEGGFESLGYAKNDPVFSMNSTIFNSIQSDMIMPENHIPLFVLGKLLRLQTDWNHHDLERVAQLALKFFKPLTPIDPQRADESSRHCLDHIFKRSLPKEVERVHTTVLTLDESRVESRRLHCLDVYRRSLLKGFPANGSSHPTDRPSDESSLHCLGIFKRRNYKELDQPLPRRQQVIPCVIDLKNAGVKFKKRKTDRFWEIKFENGVLEIPWIIVEDGTKSLFFNLIAFEQCHIGDRGDHIITSYVNFMDNLINSAEDVSHLRDSEIIEHWLGNDKEVAELFNGLCRGVVVDNNFSYLSQVYKKVNTHYKHKWNARLNAWIADLRNNYFHNPWTVISLVAAVLLLLLSSTQTYYAAWPHKS
ncbi:hypothetical protein Dimus_032443 [Dionaea muscipula]